MSVEKTTQAWRRSGAEAIDQSKLTLYDLKEDGPFQGKPEVQYPDWTEEGTFALTGPIGTESKHKGRRFRTFDEALSFYSRLQGADPVASQCFVVTSPTAGWGSSGAAKDEADNVTTANLGSRYCFRFRLPRSEALLAAGAQRAIELAGGSYES